MKRLKLLIVLLSLISVSHAELSEQEALCSFGNMKYLCENMDICKELGILGEGDEQTTISLCEEYNKHVAEDEAESEAEAEVESESESVTEPPGYDVTSDNGVTTEFGHYTTQFPSLHTRDPMTVQTSPPRRYTTDLTTAGNTIVTRFYQTTEASQEDEEEPLPLVRTGPVITMSPVNTTVAPGGEARFSCKAESDTTPQITITKRDQTTIPDTSSYDGTIHSNKKQEATIDITINNVDEPNEGWYRCLACNNVDCVYADAFLTVMDLCDGITCPGDKICTGNYDTGEGYTCVCPEYCADQDMFVADFVCTNYCEQKFNECMMKRDACANDQPGAEVMNRGMCGRWVDPTIVEAEDLYGDVEYWEGMGSTVEMECNAVGFPEPEISWYRNDDEVGRGNVLVLNDLSESDTGDYICQATNCMTTNIRRRMGTVLVNKVTTPPMLTTTPTPSPESDLANIVVDKPRSTCLAYGDPHITTYDSAHYSFMGECDYVLAMDCQMARWFIYGRFKPCGRSGGSCIETVTIYVDGDVLELQRGWLVNNNGGKIVPKNRPNVDVIMEGRNNNFTLHFDSATSTLSFKAVLGQEGDIVDRLVVLWDGYVSLQIQTPEATRTCGMCGNNDGGSGNDMRTRRAGMTDDPDTFGDSWKLDPRDRCEPTQTAKTAEEVCGEKYDEKRKVCEDLFNIPSFEECGKFHEQSDWIENCVYDECEGQMQRQSLPPKCVVAGAYAMLCYNDFWERGNSIPTSFYEVSGWEAEAGCPTAEERFEPILETGCPQPTRQEEIDAGVF